MLNSDFSRSVFKKYLLDNEKKPEEAVERIAKTVGKRYPDLYKKAMEYISRMYFIPAGGIWRAAGNPRKKISFVNCTTSIPVEDNLESIFQTSLYHWAKFAAFGQGNGINISNLRPANAALHNTAKTSTGAVSFMPMYDAVLKIIAQFGRRGATLISLIDNHPDFRAFCTVKDKTGDIESANISLLTSDAFMKAVLAKEKWWLEWFSEDGMNDIKIEDNAEELFDLLCKQTWKTGDPGMLFIDTARRESNSDVLDYPIVSTNACSFSSNTLVSTKKGLFPIIDLIGKKVEIFDGKNWVEIDSFRKTGNDELYRVYLSSGIYFDATSQHRFFLKDGSIKRTYELKESDELEYNEDIIIDGPINEKGAYLKGFMLGDGSVDPNNRPMLYLYNTKYECKKRIEESLKEIDIDNSVTNVNKEIGWVECPSNKMRQTIKGLTARDRQNLYKWGSIYKDRLPIEIYQWSLKSKLDLLAGLMDSDGTALNNKKGFGYQIASINKDFLVDVLILLNSIGIFGKISKGRKGGIRNIKGKEYLCKDVWRITISQKNAIKLSKMIKLERLISFNEGTLSYSLSFKYNKITVIEKLNRKEDVYCCTVPSTGKFLINGGILTGNSEQWLDALNVCLLSSINLAKFDEFGGWAGFEDLVRFGVMFLQACLETEFIEYRSPAPQQRQLLLDLPRIGLGITGFADYLINNEIVYGSEESAIMGEAITKKLTEISYLTSYEIGKIKGSFNKYNKEKYMQSGFVKRMLDEGVIQEDTLKYQAHVCKNTIAPVGTGSIIAECGGSGIEPLFSKYMVRRERTSGDYKEWFIFNPLVEQKLKEKGLEVTRENADKLIEPYWICSYNLDQIKKVQMMGRIQKYIDSSISVTYNIPETATIEDIKQIYIEGWKNGLKGVAIFREGCKEGILITEVNYNKSVKEKRILLPRRPTDLPCNIHELTVLKERHIVLVGLMDGKPYEIFVTKDSESKIDLKQYKTGIIRKVAKGKYDLIVQNGEQKTIITDINATFNNSMMGTLSRLVSMSLRHNVPIPFIVDQLSKTDNFSSFERAVSRVLKKYIPENSEVLTENGCPVCGKPLIYQGGCRSCTCGWSKCD